MRNFLLGLCVLFVCVTLAIFIAGGPADHVNISQKHVPRNSTDFVIVLDGHNANETIRLIEQIRSSGISSKIVSLVAPEMIESFPKGIQCHFFKVYSGEQWSLSPHERFFFTMLEFLVAEHFEVDYQLLALQSEEVSWCSSSLVPFVSKKVCVVAAAVTETGTSKFDESVRQVFYGRKQRLFGSSAPSPNLFAGPRTLVTAMVEDIVSSFKMASSLTIVPHYASWLMNNRRKIHHIDSKAVTVTSVEGLSCQEPTACQGSYGKVIVDIQECFRGPRTSCPQRFRFRESHILTRNISNLLQSLAHPHVQTTWRSIEFSSDSTTFDDSASCLQGRNGLLSMCSGYTAKKVETLVLSFLQNHRRGCTTLYLFVECNNFDCMRPWRELERRSNTSIKVVDVVGMSLDSGRLAQCGPEKRRFEILLRWLRSNFSRDEGLSYIAFSDSRDVFVQNDPFEYIAAIPRRKSSDFVSVVAEGYFLGIYEYHDPAPFLANRQWLIDDFGPTFFRHLSMGLLSTGDPFPIICSGLFFATRYAAINFLEVLVPTLESQLPRCGWDQGAFNAVVYAGLDAANFQHDVYLLNPFTSPFSNRPPRGIFLRWSKNRRLLNCNEKEYSIMHQFDRYPSVWEEMQSLRQLKM
jgi:hypothetical protein